MQRTLLLTAVLTLSAAPLAVAQEAPYSQTLDEQMERVAEGKSAVPMEPQMSAPVSPVSSSSANARPANEWPAAANGAAPLDLSPSAGSAIDSTGGDAIPALPLDVVTTSTGIHYLTGGVGGEEEAQLKSVASQYNLQILMSANGGAYLSGVTLRILNAQNNEVLSAADCGPYFYTVLPPGSYTVEFTTLQGSKQSAKVKVPATGSVKSNVRFAE